ncbi:hypothetical protein OCU04_008472 [Sclerotinia nivalis]|uniref:Uncharacterized protein n=1 Tax=Sclerotinia nivalis TaxID=352851 RepID=A0A9X0AI46_9HELO|nr:hypothetical protein OCU04_008472 [Sclerotinia nivalis]
MRKRKPTIIKLEDGLECRKKIKTNADEMSLDEIEADDGECDEEQFNDMIEINDG